MSGADTEELARRDVANAVAPPAYGRWLATAAMLLAAAWFAWVVAINPNFEWPVVAQYFTASAILRGLGVSLGLTVIAMAIGVALGLLLAVARLSPSRPLHAGAALYIWFFRGTPLLVQLLFWYNLAALYPRLGLGIPFGPQFVSGTANSFITPLAAAIFGLGLNEGAYMAEIVRAGFLSVDEGQTDAAQSLGMTRLQTMRRVILPQAMRVIIPPTGNETISMLKNTSLVSVIAVTELLYSVQLIYAANYQTIPLLIVASLWYLIVTTVLTIGQYYIERHYAKGSARELPRTLLQRLWDNLITARGTRPASVPSGGDG